MFWRKKKEPPVLSSNPTPASAPTASPAFRQGLRQELEAVDAKDDIVTAGIGMINSGAKELMRGWLRAFGQADVFLLTVEARPEGVFCFGPNGSSDFVLVFTRLDLAEACIRTMPTLKIAPKCKGTEVLKLAHSAQKGVWINLLHEACSVSFPASAIRTLLEEAQRT